MKRASKLPPIKIYKSDGVSVRRSGDVKIFSFVAPISISTVTSEGKYIEIPHRLQKSIRCVVDVKVGQRTNKIYTVALHKKGWGNSRTEIRHPHTHNSPNICIGSLRLRKIVSTKDLKKMVIGVLSSVKGFGDAGINGDDVENEWLPAVKWADNFSGRGSKHSWEWNEESKLWN